MAAAVRPERLVPPRTTVMLPARIACLSVSRRSTGVLRPTRLLPIVLLALTAAPPRPFAASAPDPASGPVRAPAALAALKYRSLGPAWGGRVSRAAGITGDPNTYYAATASGGVWKSADGGRTWSPVFDTQPVSSIGSIAIAPSDPNVIYVGSGEANIRGNVAAGNGIYKSVDAGRTWTHVWRQEGQIGTMVVHPGNPDVAFAAVLGRVFGPNPERGVYRTTDGGRTWLQVLKKDADTGASDVALDPSNPRVVFAGLWQARRRPWELVSGGPGSGLHVSRDGGDTWTQLTGRGLPEGVWGKVGVAIAPSDPKRVYALIEAEQGGLFRSDDRGESWTRASGYRGLRQRAWYYSTLTVHPTNPNEVWFPQVPMLRTIDGGRTIELVRDVPHGDHHDVWFDPRDPERIVVAHDGGVAISVNGGDTWVAPPLPIGQLYHIDVDTRVPFHVAGTLQDIGTAQGPSDSLRQKGPTAFDWYGVGGGEAGHVVSDPTDPNIVYAGEYLGIVTRYDHRTRQARNVSAWPDNPSGWGGVEMKYRFQWTAPIAISPHDPRVVYHAAQVLFRTGDGGQTWRAISPDLTRNDPARQQWSGGPITGDNTGVETYCTIFAVAESPVERGLIWAGSDDGLVHVTRDGGTTWTNVTKGMAGLPEWATIATIEPSRREAGTAWVVADAHRLDDARPYLFRTADFGRTWTRLDASLPRDVYLHVVRQDPVRPDLLYLGTETGVMFSSDGGSRWQPLQLNLPTVAVHDLKVQGNALVVGTHGRSIWILDDLQAVRETTPEVTARPVFLYPGATATAWRYSSGPTDASAGENPPHGAAIYYFLKEKAGKEMTLDVLDARGALVRRLSSTPRPPDGSEDFDEPEEKRKGDLPQEAGVQRAVWDLRYEGAKKIKGAKIDTGDPAVGPLVPPGTYTLRLEANGQVATSSVKVERDPRGAIAQEDVEAQTAFALQVRDDISRLTGIVNSLRSVRDQLNARRAAMAAAGQGTELVAMSDGLVRKLDALEEKLHNPRAEVVYDILAMKGGAHLYSRLSPLLMFAIEGDGVPTQGMREVRQELERELDRYAADYAALVERDLAALNDKAVQARVPFVVVPRP
jgi:photosystem II stability/assembly factor-like uncharacterized protein